MRRALPLLLSFGVLLSVGSLSPGARAAPPRTPAVGEVVAAHPSVDVVKVQGVVDPALSGYVKATIEDAERVHATVVLQIDSRGAYGDRALDLAAFIRGATVPVVAWVGPAGARAEGGALLLVFASSLAVMAPGAGVGPAVPFDLATTISKEDPAEVRAEAARLEALAPGAGATKAGADRLVSGRALPAQPALDAGAVALVAPSPGAEPDVPGLLQALDGRTVRTANGPVTMTTISAPGIPVDVRFHEIGPVRRALHAVSTPTAVYVLLVLGLWGIAFEFTQSGIGVAGVAGAVALAFAGYGLTVIPLHWLGLALVLAGMGLQALDVVVKRVGALTILGTLVFGAGSGLAWYGVAPAVDLSWWLVALFTIAGALYFGFGMTVALKARERVRTAQVGLVGLVGEVRSELNPEGGVLVKGSMWRARSMDGPIPSGTRVRVRGIDGLILRVEPEAEGQGGAEGPVNGS